MLSQAEEQAEYRKEWLEEFRQNSELSKREVKAIERMAAIPGNLLLLPFEDFASGTDVAEISEHTPEAVLLLKTQCQFILCAYETYQDAYDDCEKLGFTPRTHVYATSRRLN